MVNYFLRLIIALSLLSCFQIFTVEDSKSTIKSSSALIKTYPVPSLLRLCQEWIVNAIDQDISSANNNNPREVCKDISNRYFKKLDNDSVAKVKKVYALLKGIGQWELKGRCRDVRLSLSNGNKIFLRQHGEQIVISNASDENDRYLNGHTRYIDRLWEISPGYLVSADSLVELKLWNLKTKECLQTFKGHTDYINDVLLFSNDILITASEDFSIKIWNIQTGKCYKTLEISSSIQLLCKSDDNTFISVARDRIQKWDMTSTACIEEIEIPYLYHSSDHFLFLPKNRFIHTEKDKVKIYDITTGMLLKQLNDNNDEPLIQSICLLKDGTLAASGYTGTVKIWDITSGKCIQKIGRFCEPKRLVQLTDGDLVFNVKNGNADLMLTHKSFLSIIANKMGFDDITLLPDKTCTICSDTYNLDKNQCMQMPCCKKHLCKKCVPTIFNGMRDNSNTKIESQCPFCNKQMSDENVKLIQAFKPSEN